MRAFITEKEFEQAALDKVAAMVAHRASGIISTGNVADVSEEVLDFLDTLAIELGLVSTVPALYLEIIANENAQLRNL